MINNVPRRFDELPVLLIIYLIVNFVSTAISLICSGWLIGEGIQEVRSSDSSYAGLSLVFGLPMMVVTLISLIMLVIFMNKRSLGTLIASIFVFGVTVFPIMVFLTDLAFGLGF